MTRNGKLLASEKRHIFPRILFCCLYIKLVHVDQKWGTVGKILLHTLVGLAEDEMEVHETVNGDDLLIGSGSVLFHARYQIDFLPRGALLLNSI